MTIDEKRIDPKVLDAVAIAISGAPYTTKQSLRKASAAIIAYESAKQKEAKGWVLVPKDLAERVQHALSASKFSDDLCVAAEISALLSAGGEDV